MNVQRAENALNGEVQKLDAMAYTIGTSPDVANALASDDRENLWKMLSDERFATSNFNVLLFSDPTGKVVESKYFNLDYGHEMPFPQSLLSQIEGTRIGSGTFSGVFLLESGPILIASRPVLTGNGESTGIVVVGRYLDQVMLADLSARTELNTSIHQLNSPALLPEIQEGLLKQGYYISPLDDSEIAGFGLIRDAWGEPALALEIVTPREVSSQGRVVLNYEILALLCIGVIFSLVIMILLEKLVLSRLSRLNSRIKEIGGRKDPKERVELPGRDEIAGVAREVNAMLASLEEYQDQLVQSEERYRRLLSDANDLIFTLDSQGRITSVNRRIEEITGFPEKHLLGRNPHEFLQKGTFPPLSRHMEKSVFETTLLARNGAARVLEVSLQPQEMQGIRNGYFGIARDISDRKAAELELAGHRDRLEEMVAARTRDLGLANSQLQQEIMEKVSAEEALSAEKNRLAVTLASISEGVMATDNAGKVLLMNPVAATLTGVAPEDAIGSDIDSVIKLGAPRSEGLLSLLTDQGRIESMLSAPPGYISLYCREGGMTPVVVSTAPIEDPSGARYGSVVVFRDATRRLRWQEDMLRSAKLESLGVLAGGIAHDFNNILAAIVGHISLAMMDLPPDAPAAGRLSLAEASAMRARAITLQLMTFARGGAPVMKPGRIGDMIRETAEFVIRGRKSRVDIEVPGDLSPVEGDPAQLSQVLQNLLINADEAMEHGGTIRVEARNITCDGKDEGVPAGTYVMIKVVDEGRGIPEELREKIFDPYFTTKPSGNGLGLASVFSIVKNHRGYIRVTSTPREGSCFSVFLPALNPATKTATQESETIAERGSGKVLVMDDEEDIREIAVMALSRKGFAVEAVADGEEAVRRYREEKESGAPFDVVVMDLTIPGGMGGKEAIGVLREYDPGVKAIVSSGYCKDPVMADYAAFGFSDVMPKPYRIMDLVGKINEVVSRAHQSAAHFRAEDNGTLAN